MLLAINTAFICANLALEKDGKKLFDTLDANCKHSENVLARIDSLLQSCDCNVNQLDCVAVVLGPGSFTGLRIGASIAKGMASVNENLKLIGLSSLQLMAYIVVKQKLNKAGFVCALNALSGNRFIAKFDVEGNLLEEEKMVDSQIFNQLQDEIFTLVDDLDCGKHITITSQLLLEYALQQDSAGSWIEIEQMVPKYLRLSQAEANMLKKN